MREPEIDLDRTDLSDLLAQAQPDPIAAPGTGPKVSASVRLPLDLFEGLQRLARERGMGHTQLMAQYIAAGYATDTAPGDAMIPLARLQQVLAQIAVPPSAA
jgi:hypothetical protein